MTRKEFKTRVQRAFPDRKIEYAMNEAELLASVIEDQGNSVLTCQSSPYRDEISLFFHGQSAGLLQG